MAAGVEDEKVEEADDAEDTRAVLIELLVQRAQKQPLETSEPEPKPELNPDRTSIVMGPVSTSSSLIRCKV